MQTLGIVPRDKDFVIRVMEIQLSDHDMKAKRKKKIVQQCASAMAVNMIDFSEK